MATNTTTTNTPNPACELCAGTGTDPDFGGTCTHCWLDAEREQLLAARYAGIHTNATTDRMYTPGERLDGRTWGSAPSTTPSDAQLATLGTMVAERLAVADVLTEEQLAHVQVAQAAVTDPATFQLTRKSCSQLIDQLKAIRVRHARPTQPTQQPAGRPNRYPGTCATCGTTVEAGAGLLTGERGAWVTTHQPGACQALAAPEQPADAPTLDLHTLVPYMSSGRLYVGVPGSDSRLKLRLKLARNGAIYVDDAAVYGDGAYYGNQRPGQAYRGKVAAQLAAVVADPKAAVMRYAELTSHCGVCNAPLEDAASVARGMGPVCAQRFG